MAKDKLEELKDISSVDEGGYDATAAQLELSLRREELESRIQDRKQRKVFSYVIFGFVCLYMVAVLYVTYQVGKGALLLDKGIIITLLGTTTIDIIGLFAIVARYLFPNKWGKQK